MRTESKYRLELSGVSGAQWCKRHSVVFVCFVSHKNISDVNMAVERNVCMCVYVCVCVCIFCLKLHK